MKNKIIAGFLFLITLSCFAQSTPTEQTILNTVNQLLGTNTEQDAAVTQLIQWGVPAVPYIAEFLNDKEPNVKSAAWRAVNGIGFDSSVSFYITQLSSTNEAVRLQATKTLTSLTNKFFGYNSQDDTAKRAQINAKWNAWLTKYRATHP